MAEYKIVLASVSGGQEARVAAALGQVFGLEGAILEQIAGAAPIVLIDKLASDQADVILEAMSPVTQAGGALVISPAPEGNMPKVTWPAPPRVNGRDVASFLPGAAAAAPPQPSPAGAVGSTFRCPSCGTLLSVQSASGTFGTVGAGMPAEALPELPDVPGAVKTPPRPSSSGIRLAPMDIEDFERAVGGGGPPPSSPAPPRVGAPVTPKQVTQPLPGDPGLRALEAEPPAARGPKSRLRKKVPKQAPSGRGQGAPPTLKSARDRFGRRRRRE